MKHIRNIIVALTFVIFSTSPVFCLSSEPLSDWQSISKGLHVSFASNDIRYPQSSIPDVQQRYSIELAGWRGERISAQILLWSAEDIKEVNITSEFLKDSHTSPLPEIQTRLVSYILTDEFGNKCGFHDPEKYPASLSADVLNDMDIFNMNARNVYPIWITIDIPQDAVPGIYRVEITVNAQSADTQKLKTNLEVVNQTLPPPSQWGYFLDLWQHPSAVARVEGLEVWSEAHFDALHKYMQPLARIGQKAITATVNKEPWNNQCYDPYADMILWTRNADGSWSYDYSVFDRWVTMMMDIGINSVINCYSLLPWNNEIHYRDEAIDQIVNVKADPGTDIFNELWTAFLTDFTEHLREKGWLERTNIALDERSTEEIDKALSLLRKVAPELGIAMADNKGTYANYPDVDIMCVKVWDRMPQEFINKRRDKGLKTTYYVCCSDPFPNMFTFSSPAEGVYAGWYAAACDYDGFLRWAYNSWVEEPLTDSRFRTWPAGDSYIVYPGFRSSIRFERLMEGIQDFEKIKIIRKELIASGTPKMEEQLKQLDTALAGFATTTPKEGWIDRLVEARRMLNK
ncbi:DUF4091 domain-containing protein [Dysgonomonas reticulitermitis]